MDPKHNEVKKHYTAETQQAAKAAFDPGDSAFWGAVDAYLAEAEKGREGLVKPRPSKKN